MGWTQKLRRATISVGGLLVLAAAPGVTAATNLSAWVYPSPGGRILCQPDALGNRVLDHSGVGYRGGGVPLPGTNTVPVRLTIAPVGGDNTASIQTAINQVSALPLDTNGFRGALWLSAGVYPCSNTLYIRASGVVLRGAGSATNGSGTVLEATAQNQYTLIEVTGSGSAANGTARNITNLYVPAGARSFSVDNPSGLAVGAEVFVRRVATSAWINDLGMNLLGPAPDVPWTASGYTIDMDRVITHLEGNQVFLDAPITCAIDARYTNGTIRPFTWTGRITNVGVEHLFGKSDYFGSTTNETHGWNFLQFDHTVNGWAREVASQYFGLYSVNLNSGCKFITVQDCVSLDPISIITGGRRYAFAMNDVQLCLVKNCYNRQDRHQFVTQSLTIGPNVFVDGTSDSPHAEAGPHQRWATGILWDNIAVHGDNLDIQNAGNYGTGHGWEGANCVAWNCAASGFIVQNPPGANNWLIGCVGPIQTGTAWNIGYTNMPHAPGNYSSSGSTATNVFPDSLYYAQLQDRLAVPGLQTRDYWLGSIDQFSNAPAGGEAVFVDAAWSNTVKAAAGAGPLDGFDVVATNHWVPFTFAFTLAAGERIVAATLALALRATNSAAGDILYLGATNNAFTFAALGWLPIGTGTNTTVRLLDVTSQLSQFTNGQFNVAAQGDLGLDWAMLEMQVAPGASVTTNTLVPVADATVRGGSYAAANYGTATNLTVRQDASTSNQQLAYLSWDLSGLAGSVYQARVGLTPLGLGANGIEQGAAVANAGTWTEMGLTWNNQPGAGERFATWISSTNGPVSFDVTPQVRDALQNDRQLSLALFSVGTNTVSYASREHPNAAFQPQLVISLLGSAPTLSALTSRTIAPNTSTGPIAFTVGEAGVSATNLTVSGSASNAGLVPDGAMVFGGSGPNRTLTITPAANQTGSAVITVTVADPGGQRASASFTLTVASHAAATLVWNGPGAGLNNWSTVANWSPAEAPESLDDVKFFDPGAHGLAVSNINNVVDASFGGNIASLQYGNTNGNHTTWIGPGAQLNLTGANGLLVGTETDNGTAQTVFATVTGAGGTLALNNAAANCTVRQGTANSGGAQRATLDLSGLGAFSANLNQVLVGVFGPVNRATGTLYLARTNLLTAVGSPGILAADNPSNNGGTNYIYLGQSNALFVDSLVIAQRKGTATLKFNPALAGASALFRATDGTGRVASWGVGDNALESNSSSSALGVCDFSSGTLDALVDTLVIGRSQTTTGANSSGTFTFTAGVLDVNTLQVGFQAASGATSAGVGRVNVAGSNAVLTVNTLLELGHTSGGAGTTNTSGSVFLNGGTLNAASISAGVGSGGSSLLLNQATLNLAGTAGSTAIPLSLVALTNATLQFSVASGVTNLFAASLVTGGTSNAIVIAAVPGDVVAPAQFPLAKFSGAVGGRGFNFLLAAMPPDAAYTAYLSNNTASSSLDLVITRIVPADPFLTWNGNLSGDWDTETPNWKNNVGTGLSYADGDAVVFNDTAGGTTDISLADTFTPAGVTVSNQAKTFSFGDIGNLVSGGALMKHGAGTLVLANAATNAFTGAGGIIVSNGVLVVNNALAGSAVSVYGGTLGGTGSIFAPVAIYRGATLAPGGPPGVLGVANNLTLAGGSTVAAQINAQTGGATQVRGLSNVVYGGTLTITNLAGTLAAGQSFPLFSALGASGSFTNIAPSLGPGLAWSFAPANGILAVVALAPPQFTNFTLGANGAFTLAGTGPAGQTYRILAATNPATPFTNWFVAAGGAFTGGRFSFTDPATTNYPQRYYRLSAP